MLAAMGLFLLRLFLPHLQRRIDQHGDRAQVDYSHDPHGHVRQVDHHYKEGGPGDPSLQDRISETNGKNHGYLNRLRSCLQRRTGRFSLRVMGRNLPAASVAAASSTGTGFLA